MLLKYAIKEFIDDRKFKQLSAKTVTSYQSLLNEFYQYCVLRMEVVEVSEVTQNQIRNFLLSCQEKGNCPVTINTKLRTIKTLFNYLEEIELIPIGKNPARRVSFVKTEGKVTTFSDEQVKQILQYFRRMKGKTNALFAVRDSTMFTTLISTGMRCGELCNLKWSDVDLINNHIILFGKLRVQQGMPIVPKLKTELLEWRVYCEREFGKLPVNVFTNRKGMRLTENAVACVFKRLRVIFKFKDVRCCCHDCRRYYASSLIRNGADAFTVQQLMRHSDLTMTKKYVQIFGNELEKRNLEYNPLNHLDI